MVPGGFDFSMSALPLDLVERFSRCFGSLNEAGDFVPYVYSGLSFELAIANETATLIRLNTAGGHIVPRTDGWIDFAIPGPACKAAGIQPNTTYRGEIVQIAGTAKAPFASGTLMWEREMPA